MLTVRCLHNWTNEAFSQYVDKSVFNFLWKCDRNRNMVSHFIGPCDGLGGTTKRMADEAIKSGKVVIQNASEFMTWTQSPTCSMWNVKFMFVPKEVCESTEKELETLPFKAVNRAIEAILLREGSCHCNNNLLVKGPMSLGGLIWLLLRKMSLLSFGDDKNTVMTTTQSETCIVY